MGGEGKGEERGDEFDERVEKEGVENENENESEMRCEFELLRLRLKSQSQSQSQLNKIKT